MPEPQPISGKRIWLEFHVVRSGVDTGGHHYCSRVFGAAEIRGIHESGMGPYFPRVRRKCPSLMGLYPPRTALWSSNQSAISQRDWGFLTVQGGVDPRKLRLLPRLMETFRDVERPLDRGWDPISSRGGASSTCEPWPIRKSAGRWGWDFHTVREGIMSAWIPIKACDLSCPGDAFFVYESSPMRDQKNTDIALFSLNKTRV